MTSGEHEKGVVDLPSIDLTDEEVDLEVVAELAKQDRSRENVQAVRDTLNRLRCARIPGYEKLTCVRVEPCRCDNATNAGDKEEKKGHHYSLDPPIVVEENSTDKLRDLASLLRPLYVWHC